MRSRVQFLALIGAILALAVPSAGQITITASDAGAILALGKTSWTYQDTLTTSLNIGSPGASSWDFRSLHVNAAATLTSVAPGSTPYSADFPGATHAFQTAQSLSGFVLTVYQYFTLTTNLLNPGTKGGVSTQFGDVVYSLTNSPAATVYALPSTYGTSWTTAYSETELITLGGFPFVGPTVTAYTESLSVDAYGPMTVPGGAVYQALRIRFREHSPGLSIGYIFIAKEGAIITIKAADTLSLPSGTIQIAGASWISPTAVGVADVHTAPTQFDLSQNFPNPFNPSTVITYSIPGGGTVASDAHHVRLAVYDLLGREVTVLVNEAKAPGVYTVKFDARGMSSGVYLYRLESGTFVQTRSMLLVR